MFVFVVFFLFFCLVGFVCLFTCLLCVGVAVVFFFLFGGREGVCVSGGGVGVEGGGGGGLSNLQSSIDFCCVGTQQAISCGTVLRYQYQSAGR